MNRWVYILSALTDDKFTQYVLNVDGNEAVPQTAVILWPLQPNSTNELWQFTSDGRILSALNNQLVLSLGPAYSKGPGYTVIVDTLQGPAPPRSSGT
jgi:hypothetical protein